MGKRSALGLLATAIAGVCVLAACSAIPKGDPSSASYDAFDQHDFDAVKVISSGNSAQSDLAAATLLSMLGRDEEAAVALSLIIENERDAAIVSRARRSLSGVFVRQGKFREAAEAMRANIAIQDETGVEADRSSADFFDAVSSVGKMTRSGQHSGTIELLRDKAGLPRISVDVNGVQDDAIIDTGAALSTVTVSMANNMGLRQLGSGVDIGGSTGKSVSAGLAVADKVTVGGSVFVNVPFVVVPDEAMSFSQFDYHVTSIIGLPILSRLGRIEFSKANDREMLSFQPSLSAASADEANMTTSGWEIVALGSLNEANVRQRFFLDTGARTSEVYDFAADTTPGLLNELQSKSRTQGGLGEVVESEHISVRSVRYALGGREFIHGPVFVVDDNGSFRHGSVGQDILSRFDKVTIDFGRMVIEFGSCE